MTTPDPQQPQQPQPLQPAQPQYAPPAQPQYAQPQYAPAPPTNTLAILSLIGAFVFAPLGIIFGHIATGQIKRTGESGAGLAKAGTILGYIFTALALIFIVLAIVLSIFAATTYGGFWGYLNMLG